MFKSRNPGQNFGPTILVNFDQNFGLKPFRNSTSEKDLLPLKSYALSWDYILLVLWLSIVNLNVYFFVNTWAQYTRYVNAYSYHTLVDLFGNFAWVGAVFCMCVGGVIDTISNRLRRKFDMNTGKAIGALTPFFRSVGNFVQNFTPQKY